MLEDSIARYAPGQKLHDAACMATLRYKLNFPDAMVVHYRGGRRDFLSIRLVEPGDRSTSYWRAVSSDRFQSLMPAYAPLIMPVTDTTGSVWVGRLLYGLGVSDSSSRRQMLARADSATRADYQRTITFLAAHDGEADRHRAMAALDSNSLYSNRVAAALVLTNFAEHDSTWYALVRALRDPHEAVRGAASTALTHLPRRAIDWLPAHSDLRALLGGTNLSEMEPIMRLLVETRVSPELARPLLRGNDVWLLRLLTAEAPMAARTTKSFLVHMNHGVDVGSAPAAWRAWIESR